MTREELLEKGIPGDVADQIISEMYPETNDSLQALQNFLSSDENPDTLEKAKKGGDEKPENPEDDYNEEYMKKHMKRYMKENKAMCQKNMKELDNCGDSMKKAIDGIDLDAEGAVIVMEELAPLMEVIPEAFNSLKKAISDLSDRLDVVTNQGEKSFDLLKKAGAVTAEQAVFINDYFSKPTGRKGVLENENLEKAAKEKTANQTRLIYKTLMKAVKEQVPGAGDVISAFETSGQKINRLSQSQREFIDNLIEKEAK